MTSFQKYVATEFLQLQTYLGDFRHMEMPRVSESGSHTLKAEKQTMRISYAVAGHESLQLNTRKKLIG
jgi:hypothetical protein